MAPKSDLNAIKSELERQITDHVAKLDTARNNAKKLLSKDINTQYNNLLRIGGFWDLTRSFLIPPLLELARPHPLLLKQFVFALKSVGVVVRTAVDVLGDVAPLGFKKLSKKIPIAVKTLITSEEVRFTRGFILETLRPVLNEIGLRDWLHFVEGQPSDLNLNLRENISFGPNALSGAIEGTFDLLWYEAGGISTPQASHGPQPSSPTTASPEYSPSSPCVEPPSASESDPEPEPPVVAPKTNKKRQKKTVNF